MLQPHERSLPADLGDKRGTTLQDAAQAAINVPHVALVAIFFGVLMPANTLGTWSALTVFIIGVAYVVTLAAGFAVHGLSEPIVDPILAVMEVLTVISALAMVILMAAIHDRASGHRRVHGVIALSFTALFAGITCAVHFVELTAVRQTASGGIVWPSPEYAAELLAWDLFLGLALLFAAAVFETEGLERGVRRGLLISGGLCVAGIVGPMAGNMSIQLVGVAGYAVALPATCFMLSRLFRHAPSYPAPA